MGNDRGFEALKADLRDLSVEELNEMLQTMRTSRRTPKKSSISRANKAAKQGIITKSSLTNVLSGVSPEQAAALLAELEKNK